MLPREHGAYGQLTLPLVTSFMVAGPNAAAVLIALSAVALFVAHEPALVLLGRRGPRARREQGRRAAVWLGVAAASAGVSALAGWWLMGPGARWGLVPPAAAALVLGGAVAAGREKSAPGELTLAVACSLLPVPVCLAAGARVGTALAISVVFGVIFVAGTLAVRTIVLSVRGGGDPRGARSTRIVVLVWSAAAVLGLGLTASRDILPWSTLVAAAPGLAAASSVAVHPPSPRRLKAVGWTLVLTSTAAALILMGSLAA